MQAMKQAQNNRGQSEQRASLKSMTKETQHATRTIDLSRKFQRVPKKGSEMSEEELEVEVERLEGMVVDVAREIEGGIRALLGVGEFLKGLREKEFENWGVVTSGESSFENRHNSRKNCD